MDVNSQQYLNNQSKAPIILNASTSTPPVSPISLETIELIVVYGGVSVCTILAMTIFCDVLLRRIINDKTTNKIGKIPDSKEENNQVLQWLAKILGLPE